MRENRATAGHRTALSSPHCLPYPPLFRSLKLSPATTAGYLVTCSPGGRGPSEAWWVSSRHFQYTQPYTCHLPVYQLT